MILSGFIKGNAVDIDGALVGDGLYLRQDAALAYWRMALEAARAGIALVVNSAFRTMEKQKALHKTYLVEMAKFTKGTRKTKPAPVARPGYSNHQSGVALDINRAPGDDLATAAPDSPIDLWLAKNAARFGFKRTVASEPWHWEFVS